ncbi:MAG: hypothetical protein UY35_C0019G0010 [Candidatus Saccharibacteria bacterium GW2011_GWC2_48_9]|nr:MAG: hypothetical protein UY35_C0019G0010 [Candidatus Saccharibacteria bacterium GW2011_GWC2_48_9]HCH33965.1 hypothetical protein [Candidatus Saccharibacteria bacterium]
MNKLSEKDIASIYPTPKTYNELQEERVQRELSRRPKNVPTKIGSWTALGVVTILGVQQIVPYVTAYDLSSAGGVLFGVTFSLLAVLATGAMLYYLYAQTRGLVDRVLDSPGRVYAQLIAVVGVTLFVLLRFIEYIHAAVVVFILALHVLAVYHIVQTAIRVKESQTRK